MLPSGIIGLRQLSAEPRAYLTTHLEIADKYFEPLIYRTNTNENMKPEEQNRAIALHCGLKETQSPAGPYWYHADHPQCQDGAVLWELPDYNSDLNAMADAEKTLKTEREQNCYTSNIAEVCYANYERRNNQVVFNQLTATAEERSEAFLRTIGSWKQPNLS